MFRILLSMTLCLFSVSALATSRLVGEDVSGGGSRPGKPAISGATQEADSATAGHPAVVPVRVTTPRLPRWHSLLPGMIR